MRVLLDENLPVALAALLGPHEVERVSGMGWPGLRNGELLERAAGQFDAMITMDGNLEFQQPIHAQPLGIIVLRAASNRMHHVEPLVSDMISALAGLGPGDLRKIGRDRP